MKTLEPIESRLAQVTSSMLDGKIPKCMVLYRFSQRNIANSVSVR